MGSLWQAIAIILVASFVSLGVRPGAIVALAIPLTLLVKAILIDTDPTATWATALFGSTRAMRHESEVELADGPTTTVESPPTPTTGRTAAVDTPVGTADEQPRA